MSAPVPHTCPTIDSVIEDIKGSKNEIDEILNGYDYLTPNDIQTRLIEVSNILDRLYGSPRSDMEEIRTANAKLREWGFEGEEKISELEYQIKDLENEINRLKY